MEQKPVSELSRLRHELDFADKIKGFEAGVESPNDGRIMADVLERRDWGHLFREAKKGRRILTFKTPSDEVYNLKKMNDKVLGPTRVDEIFIFRRKLMDEAAKKIGAKVVINPVVADVMIIDEARKNITEDELTEIAREIKEKMTAKILALAESAQEPGRREAAAAFIKEFKKSGYEVRFGVADIEGDDEAAKISAVSRSLQACKMAAEGEFGSVYNPEKILQTLERISVLTEEIDKAGNEITDANGFSYYIMIQGSINIDVLRMARSYSLKVKKGDTDGAKQLSRILEYLSLINNLDNVKPFTMKEVDAGETKKRIARHEALAEKVRSGDLSDDERAEAAKSIERDEKDGRFTARSIFHQRASAMSHCHYILIDVRDIGVEQLKKYERRTLAIAQLKDDATKVEAYEQASLEADDDTTEKLRRFRDVIVETVREKFSLSEAEEILGFVGGDELNLAIDGDKFGQEKVDELIFAIKARLAAGGVEARIQTVVSQAEKDIDSASGQEEKLQAHFESLKMAEEGADIAKAVEDLERKLNYYLIRGEEYPEEGVAPERLKDFLGDLNWLFEFQNKKFKCVDFKVEALGDERVNIVGRKSSLQYSKKEIKAKLESFITPNDVAKMPKELKMA